MPKGQNRKKGIISAAIFIILEVAALNMLSCTNGLQGIWVKRLVYRPLSVLWRGGESVRGYFLLKGQNERLAAENFALSEQLRKAGQSSQASTPFRRDNMLHIPARIVRMSRNSQHNYIILDKGAADGVAPFSGVISDKGVVGIVDVVDEHYSYGLTLMNSAVQVSARLGREGLVAPLSWDGMHSDGALLTSVPLHYEACPGDTVYTSGYSSIFPSDIALGTVQSSGTNHGAMGEVRLKLFQDFSLLKYVTIVRNLDKQVIDSLSAHGEGALK